MRTAEAGNYKNSESGSLDSFFFVRFHKSTRREEKNKCVFKVYQTPGNFIRTIQFDNSTLFQVQLFSNLNIIILLDECIIGAHDVFICQDDKFSKTEMDFTFNFWSWLDIMGHYKFTFWLLVYSETWHSPACQHYFEAKCIQNSNCILSLYQDLELCLSARNFIGNNISLSL